MNNEDKILELLGQLTRDMAGVKSEIVSLKENQAEMQTTITKVAVTQENIVLPRLQALYEGQQNLRDTLAPKNRVEALEEEIALLKDVIRAHSRDIAELKKAQ